MNTKVKIFILILISFFPIHVFAQNTIEIKNPEDAIKFALSNNKDLIVSRQLASANFKRAKNDIGDFLPKLNISYNDSSIVNPNSADYQNKNLEVGLSWILYDGGQKKCEYNLKKIEASYSKIDNEGYIKEHCLKIMKIYYEYQKHLQNKKIIIQTLENANRWKNTLAKELDLGMILETDFMDYEIKCLELERKILESEDTLRNLEYQMKNLMGLKITDQLEMISNTDIDSTILNTEGDMDTLYSQALINSSGYRKLKMEIVYGKKLKDLEKSFLLPKISFQPAVSFQGNDYPLRGPKYQMMFTVSFDRNPFMTIQSSQTISSTRKTIMESTSYSQSASKNNLTWKEDNLINKLNSFSMINSLTAFEENLKFKIYELVTQRKQLLSAFELLEKDINLNQKLNSIIEKEIEHGLKKTMDLLDHQIVLSEKKSSLYASFVKILVINKEIDFLTSNNNGGAEYEDW